MILFLSSQYHKIDLFNPISNICKRCQDDCEDSLNQFDIYSIIRFERYLIDLELRIFRSYEK